MALLAQRREELRAAEHPLQLLGALVVAERLDARVGRVAGDLLDAKVAVGDTLTDALPTIVRVTAPGPMLGWSSVSRFTGIGA